MNQSTEINTLIQGAAIRRRLSPSGLTVHRRQRVNMLYSTVGLLFIRDTEKDEHGPGRSKMWVQQVPRRAGLFCPVNSSVWVKKDSVSWSEWDTRDARKCTLLHCTWKDWFEWSCWHLNTDSLSPEMWHTVHPAPISLKPTPHCCISWNLWLLYLKQFVQMFSCYLLYCIIHS